MLFASLYQAYYDYRFIVFPVSLVLYTRSSLSDKANVLKLDSLVSNNVLSVTAINIQFLIIFYFSFFYSKFCSSKMHPIVLRVDPSSESNAIDYWAI